MGGAFLPDDSAIDPRHYATALEMGIREYGGEIRRDITIEGLHEVGGHIRGVRTSDTTIGADHVILCDGEKTHDILASCGVHIPMTYGQQTMVRLRRDEKGPRHILCTSRLSIIPSAAHLLVTRPVQHEVLGNDPLLGDLHALSVDTTKVIADLQKSPAEEVVAWTTAVTTDGTPYVGRLPQFDGLILAVGLSHRTTLLSAMIGEWVQMALNGQPLPDLAHEVAPDRRETVPSTAKPVPEAPSRRGGPIFIPPL
jgi:glycine oxidase